MSWLLVICMYGNTCSYMPNTMPSKVVCADVAVHAMAAFSQEEIIAKDVKWMCVRKWEG